MIQFNTNDVFYQSVKLKAERYFSTQPNNRFVNGRMKVKLLVLYGFTFLCYALIFLTNAPLVGVYVLAFLYGIGTFLIAFNVVHDAGHHALFKSKNWNSFFLYSLDLFGVSSFVWKTTHHFHHHSPNVLHHDSLVDDFKLGKIVPSSPHRWLFKFQVFYIPILSLVYSLSLVVVSDFLKFSKLIRKVRLSKIETLIQLIVMVISKVFVVITTFILPHEWLGLTWMQALGLVAMMHLGPGLIVGFFVAPAHFNTHLSFPEPDETGKIATTWSEHQLRTTADFATDNPVLNFTLGGFNHHVAHHLFPNVCHIHYKQLTKIIAETAREFHLTYHCSSFWNVYAAHLKHLYLLGKAKE